MVVVKITVAEVEPERLGEEVQPELLGEEVEPELLGEEVQPEYLEEQGQRGGRGRARGQRPTRQPSVAEVPWEEVDPNSDEVTPILPFTEPVGPVRSLPDHSTPFEFYSLIVDRSVVEILVTEINK